MLLKIHQNLKCVHLIQLDQGGDEIDCYIPRNEDEDINDNDADGDSDEDSTFFAEFSQHKNDYYINKLEYEKVTP